MRKTIIKSSLIFVLGGSSLGVQASLINGSVLQIDSGVGSCILDSGTYPLCDFGTTVSSGSYFDFNSSGAIPITGVEGVILGTIQAPGNTHPGSITFDEGPSIDIWEFMDSTGMDYTTSETNVLSASGNMATVDFSGWSMDYDGITDFSLGTGAWGGNAEGTANIECGVDCGNNDSYTLDYTATVPLGDPSGFGGSTYSLHLTGTISSVPVPASVWLFGSGLVGLIGLARRK